VSARQATIHTGTLPGAAPRLRYQVLVLEGDHAGRFASLGPGEVLVGTDPACSLCLTDDRVSRRHLSVRIDGGAFVVTDLASTNGTYFEGGRITEARVPAGATLRVGRTFLRIQPVPVPLEVAPSRARRFGDLVGESLAMREVFGVLELCAATDITVLLEGETGTGKELAARALHDHGPRRRAPFVAIDCGALPESLLESELFGHVRGAFTGAQGARAGAFVRAHEGTIFLDELGKISPAAQARLLRVVEERRVRPVGSDDEREVQVRVVCASRDDLSAQVARGEFRADLYYRLSVVRVKLPPLRSRREDLPLLVQELLRRRGIDAGPVGGPGAELLQGHGWPGNVRELRNVIDRAVALGPTARAFSDLRLAVGPQPERERPEPLGIHPELPWAEARQLVIDAFEQGYLRELLARVGGNLSAASRASGLDRKHLRALVRRHGLVDPDG
jgi:DNA-binding NtrC family response regulator